MVPSSTNNYMPKFSSVQDFQEMGPSRLEEDCSTSVINFGHSETSNRHSCFDKYTILIHQWVATHII
ncbi:hypothetical protein Ahy_A03g015197 isoform C [Arachis hypogaea]|uniref:Uncharacterized protein n=1 Tax=Arachis hypogaea TaxID=3818 RepID=A0A445E017_ARAHY|nr:hypothetical protein Ahy_A03g015197 isoform C [Arachis hypogaea]